MAGRWQGRQGLRPAGAGLAGGRRGVMGRRRQPVHSGAAGKADETLKTAFEQQA